MARYGIIKNNIITNVIEANAEFIKAYSEKAVLLPDNVGLGFSYINEEFIYIEPIKTEEEIQIEAIEWRNNELVSTDFIAQTPDYPNRDAWITYRQELRDWPSTADFPKTKPTKPE